MPGTFIKLIGHRFNNPNLPVVTDPREDILSIPSLFAWYTTDEGYYQTDSQGDLELIEVSGSGINLAKDPIRTSAPTVVQSALNGQSAIDVTPEGGLKRQADDVPVDGVTFFAVFLDEGSSAVATNRWIVNHDSVLRGLGAYSSGDTANLLVNAPGGSVNNLGSSTGVRGVMASKSGGSVYSAASEAWGTVQETTGHGDVVTPSLYVGQSSSDTSVFQGKIGDVIVLNKAVTSASDPDYITIREYLSAKYGL